MAEVISYPREIRRNKALTQNHMLTRDISFLQPTLALLAADLQVPVGAINIIGRHFQHIKVSVGTDLVMLHLQHSFCVHMLEQDGLMVVEDAAKDVRFRNNPYVVNEPKMRFYAGAPLQTADGHKVGSVCILDDKPRSLTASQRARLMSAASEIAVQLRSGSRDVPVACLDAKQILRLIEVEADTLTRERATELIEALYRRLDETLGSRPA